MVTISRSSTYSRGPVTGRARTSMALTLLICCRAQWVGGHVGCVNLHPRTLHQHHLPTPLCAHSQLAEK